MDYKVGNGASTKGQAGPSRFCSYPAVTRAHRSAVSGLAGIRPVPFYARNVLPPPSSAAAPDPNSPLFFYPPHTAPPLPIAKPGIVRSSLRQATFIGYLIVIHGLLALMLWKSDFLLRLGRKLAGQSAVREITDFYNSTLLYQLRKDGNVPDGSVVFIGDSLTQGLCSDAVAYPSVNYGIGGDTTVGVLARLPQYHSLNRASAVVLAIGANDMKFRDNQQIIANYRQILRFIPASVPVVSSAVLPVNESLISRDERGNARIRELNTLLKTLCSAYPHCVFVDPGSDLVDSSGNLAAAFQDGDGVHLNSTGNQIWIDALRVAVVKAQQSGSAGWSSQSIHSDIDRASAAAVSLAELGVGTEINRNKASKASAE